MVCILVRNFQTKLHQVKSKDTPVAISVNIGNGHIVHNEKKIYGELYFEVIMVQLPKFTSFSKCSALVFVLREFVESNAFYIQNGFTV